MDKILMTLLCARLFYQQTQAACPAYSVELQYVWENIESALKYFCYENSADAFFTRCGGTCFREEEKWMKCDDCDFNDFSRDDLLDSCPVSGAENSAENIIALLNDALSLMGQCAEQPYSLAPEYLQRAIVAAKKLARVTARGCEGRLQ